MRLFDYNTFWKKTFSPVLLVVVIVTFFGNIVEAAEYADYGVTRVQSVSAAYIGPGDIYQKLVTGSDGFYGSDGKKFDTKTLTPGEYTTFNTVYYKKYGNIIAEYRTGDDGKPEFITGNDDYIQKIYVVRGPDEVDAYNFNGRILKNTQENDVLSSIAAGEGKGNDFVTRFNEYGNQKGNTDAAIGTISEINKIDDRLKQLEGDNSQNAQVERDALLKKKEELQNQANNYTNNANRASKELNQVSGAGGASCNLSLSGFNFLGCLAAIFNFFLELFSVPLILAAYMFDFVIGFTIGGFKEAVNGSLKAPIENVWNLIRNFSNLIFIATILYIAFKTLMNANGFGDYKLLGKVIAFAFLINFSLLFTKLAIDASNIATTEIYNGITSSLNKSANGNIQLNQVAKVQGGSGLSNSIINFGNSKGGDASLAAVFLNNMLISKVYDGSGQSINAGNIVSNGLLGSIMLLVAAFVFFAISIAFIARFFILIVLMMTSPIVFASGLLPGVSNQSGMWKKSLTEQCVFAPTFMIMVYIALQMQAGISKALESNTTTTGLMVNYIITIVSMVACLVVARSAGASASAINYGKTLGGALAFGGIGFAGRRLGGGYLGGKLTKWGENGIASNSALGKLAGRLSLQAGGKLKDSSFDVRNINGAGAYLGNGSKSNFNAINKEKKNRAERERKIVEERTKLTDEEKIRLAQSDNINHAQSTMDSAKSEVREAAEKEKQAKKTKEDALKELKDSGSAALKSQHDLLTADIATATLRANNTGLSDVDRQRAKAELEVFRTKEKEVIAKIKEEAKTSNPAKLKNLEDAEKAEKTNREKRIKANETIIAAQQLLSKSTEDLVKNLEKLGKLPKDIEKQIATAKAQGTPTGKAEAERLEKMKADAIKQDRSEIKKSEADNKQAYLKWLQESSGGLINSASYGSNMQKELNKYILDGLKGNSARELDKILKAIKDATKENKEGE